MLLSSFTNYFLILMMEILSVSPSLRLIRERLNLAVEARQKENPRKGPKKLKKIKLFLRTPLPGSNLFRVQGKLRILNSCPTQIEFVYEQLVVVSRSSNKQILRTLLLKLFWSEEGLSDIEWTGLTLLALEDMEILEIIKYFQRNPMFLVRKLVNSWYIQRGEKPFSQREFFSRKGLEYEFNWALVHRPPPLHIEKYSSWKRHQNDQGSLNNSNIQIGRQLEGSFNEERIFSLRRALSVGILPIEPTNDKDKDSLKKAIISAETDFFLKLLKEVNNDPGL